MHQVVRIVLEAFLREKRIPTLSDIPAEFQKLAEEKWVYFFITLYRSGKVIASSGRIKDKKENALYELIDISLSLFRDPRFSAELQSLSELSQISIRVDRSSLSERRLLQNIQELDTTKEGLILLSQNLGKLSVILPRMVHNDTSPAAYFALAAKKAGLDPSLLTPSDYVLYAITTTVISDF